MKRTVLLTILTVLSFLLLCSASQVIAQDFCEGNFDYDSDVDGTDASVFKENFGRSAFKNPCPPDGPAPLPKTGQTTAYANGDDGTLQRGVAWPNPRFTDNGDGTVTDNLTGLIWLKDANCSLFNNPRTWNDAIDIIVPQLADGYCGLTDGSSPADWRLPNRFELQSLHSFYSNPFLPDTAGTGQWSEGDPFTNVNFDPPQYWTATTNPNLSDFAFTVEFSSATVAIDHKLIQPANVWPVRGGH